MRPAAEPCPLLPARSLTLLSQATDALALCLMLLWLSCPSLLLLVVVWGLVHLCCQMVRQMRRLLLHTLVVWLIRQLGAAAQSKVRLSRGQCSAQHGLTALCPKQAAAPQLVLRESRMQHSMQAALSSLLLPLLLSHQAQHWSSRCMQYQGIHLSA